MEFRKMVTMTLYARQQKRHIYIEQSFGLCGRRRGCDGLGEWHWNMYIIICEMNHQFRMGNTCTPVADSCQCMAKPIQYCKIISLQLKEINLYWKKSCFYYSTVTFSCFFICCICSYDHFQKLKIKFSPILLASMYTELLISSCQKLTFFLYLLM